MVMGVLADTRSLVKGSETMAAKFVDAALRRKTAIAATSPTPSPTRRRS
jgi:hypothetical protein